MAAATVVSVRVGRTREWPRPEWDRSGGRTWRTAYVKDEADGPVHVTSLGLVGDEQAHRDVHGGPHMAVLAYAAAHYAHWLHDPALAGIGPGGFGENLTVKGLVEADVCIGDVWQTDHLALQVSQPRGPCAAISRRWNDPTLMQRAIDGVRIGWYLRVLREGPITRGEVLELAERPCPEWTVERVFQLRIEPAPDPLALAALAACEALSPEWRHHMAARRSTS